MSQTVPALDLEKELAALEPVLANLKSRSVTHDHGIQDQVRQIEAKIQVLRENIYANLTPWQRVQIARHPSRPYFLDYASLIFEEFIELHGDRFYGDDQALIGGFARLGQHRVIAIGHQKGRDTKERTRRNFGMANPEGYRKALRLMRLADKFGLPILTFIDTPGAFPGVEAEERHISEAIAVNLREMFRLRVPVIATIIGEGGSGGALGIGVANRVLILENSYYSVISPEGCAAILWKDRAHAPRAAEALRITSHDLLSLGLVDSVVPEPVGGAHTNKEIVASSLRDMLMQELEKLLPLSDQQRAQQRQEKFRQMGQWGQS